MVKLDEEQLDNLLVSEFDNRIKNNSTEAPEGMLKEMFRECASMETMCDEITSGGQFSVFASLPSVSSAVNSACASSMKSLVSVLRFATGGDVYPSDVKDWSFVEDALDSLFSRIDESMALESRPAKKARLSEKPTPAGDLTKPQSAWQDNSVNFRKGFVPILKEKLNAIEPLDTLVLQAQQDPTIVKNGFEFPNVYEAEIKACLKRVTEDIQSIESINEIVDFSEITRSDFVFVDTLEKLDEMVEAILASGEVAIDLEHHDVHSYRGFTCLIQLSTRTTDYVLDPFPLFNVFGSRMNKFTTDPRIKKTFHGADMDIQWLQRDFGVFVVNMFDTGQAARALGLAGGFSLANLLDSFCKIKANKRFQTSDWRTRPLPKDMLLYARSDTHYLLYIRDRLEGLLLGMGSGSGGLVTAYGKKMLGQVMEKSFGVSLKVWRDPACDFTQEGADQLCLKSPALKVGQLRGSLKGMAVLRAVLEWRDQTARALDESRNFVLSNAACLRIANVVPTAVPQILRLLMQESSSIHPSMYIGSEEAEQLLDRIRKASESFVKKEDEKSALGLEIELDRDMDMSSRRSSVVQVGGAFRTRVSDQSRRSCVGSRPENLEVEMHAEPSSLFEFFNTVGEVQSTDKYLKLMKQLVEERMECPPILQESLERFRAGNLVSEESVEKAAEAMASAIAAVPFGTEFVPFTNRKSADQPMPLVDEEGLPLTLREQRKRAPETSTPASAKKRQKREAKTTAAVKALEFVEEELSLSKSGRK
jgi:exosome complex exonuclease RRP6